ncbi:MAG: caspase family protein [Flavobacteriales bacterium]|nr:caspase family protein [Flavobacteriales bacterium]
MKNLFFILSALFCLHVHGQSVYEIKFHDQQNVANNYIAFLVYYNEGDAYMRIGYYNNKKEYRVVEVDYEGKSGKWSDGRSYFSLTGNSVKYITESTNDEKYNPDYFVWINEGTLPYTTDEPENGQKSRTVYPVDSFKKINIDELTETYLRQFYYDYEEDYISLLQMATDVILPNVDNESITMHLIILANTDISDIGSGCRVDLQHLITEFEEIANTLNISFAPYEISSTDFNKTELVNTLDDLIVNSNDIVFFVYRGHGFRWSNQESNYPSLALTRSHTVPLSSNNTILLEEVYDSIVSKGGRLNIVLGDCCNSSIGISQSTADNYLYMQSNASAKYNKLYDLFINRQGSLLVSASDVGEVSWTNSHYGGFFTSSFLQALSEEISYMKETESSWINIINNTKSFALNKASGCSVCKPQHAIAKNLITKK